MTEKLSQIIKKLGKHQDVDGVFVTGSQGDDYKPYSDIDLVIILNDNHHKISSLYTWIDEKFADIFFFDQPDLEEHWEQWLQRVDLYRRFHSSNG